MKKFVAILMTLVIGLPLYAQNLREQMAEFLPGKCELFPLPAEEINLNPLMTQNPGY